MGLFRSEPAKLLVKRIPMLGFQVQEGVRIWQKLLPLTPPPSGFLPKIYLPNYTLSLPSTTLTLLGREHASFDGLSLRSSDGKTMLAFLPDILTLKSSQSTLQLFCNAYHWRSSHCLTLRWDRIGPLFKILVLLLVGKHIP